LIARNKPLWITYSVVVFRVMLKKVLNNLRLIFNFLKIIFFNFKQV